jgi:hypothetical protein
MRDPDNDVRAARALIAYSSHLGKERLVEGLGTVVSDLLGDLRHLFDALDVDWEATAESALEHYRGEIVDDL